MSTISSNSVKADKVSSGALYSSDICELKYREYDFLPEEKSSKGCVDCLRLVYVNKGNFLLDLTSDSLDTHSGHVVIDKPNHEYQLRPSSGVYNI